MAILQTRIVQNADHSELPLDGETPTDFVTRLRELHFNHPSDQQHKMVFEVFAGGLDGSRQDDVVIELLAEPQEQVPPEDTLDPETKEVLISAGSVKSRIPSVAELRATPLPEGPQTIRTFGELFDASRRQLYLAAIGLNQNWADGTEG